MDLHIKSNFENVKLRILTNQVAIQTAWNHLQQTHVINDRTMQTVYDAIIYLIGH